MTCLQHWSWLKINNLYFQPGHVESVALTSLNVIVQLSIDHEAEGSESKEEAENRTV